MKNLSQYLNPDVVSSLKEDIRRFQGISFEQAMQFILTDGMVPVGGLPARSFLELEDWLRSQDKSAKVLSYSTTELKNKTGEILDQVAKGNTVKLLRHGRAIAELRRV
jgi:hypothetical protein